MKDNRIVNSQRILNEIFEQTLAGRYVSRLTYEAHSIEDVSAKCINFINKNYFVMQI